jgi:Spy/CpxP family protein refolding chaperone
MSGKTARKTLFNLMEAKMKKVLVTAFQIGVIAVAMVMLTWSSFNSPAFGADPGSPAITPGQGAVPQGDSQPGEHPGKGWHKGCHHGMHRFLEKLNLTDAQKEQVRSIMSEERAKMKPLKDKLKEGRKEMRAATKDGAFDEAQVRSIAGKQASTITEMIVIRQRIKTRIYKILTPEQRAQAQQLREAWKEKHKEQMEQKQQ